MEALPENLKGLSAVAWQKRKNAVLYGATSVGAAVRSRQGDVFGGCNVEHQYRSHDIHAEVCAIAAMASAGHRQLVAILIAAERSRFTPCGACMDWIFQFGGPECLVAYQSAPDAPVVVHTARELMPHYPQ